MKNNTETLEFVFPSYALPYLVNGDASSLEDEDKQAVDAWMESVAKKCKKLGARRWHESATGESLGFCHKPAFGLACDCEKVEFVLFGYTVDDTRPHTCVDGALSLDCSPNYIDAPLWWHRKGLQYTASGYGAKIPTSKKLWFENKLRRVYCTIYGNAGSCWIFYKGNKVFVS